ncbi:MAG: hypothetical protein ACO3D4_01260 [Vulcanococcus sp.]
MPPTQDELLLTSELWLLLPWCVFALAAGLKFWRLTQPFRTRKLVQPRSDREVRAALERLWQRSPS